MQISPTLPLTAIFNGIGQSKESLPPHLLQPLNLPTPPSLLVTYMNFLGANATVPSIPNIGTHTDKLASLPLPNTKLARQVAPTDLHLLPYAVPNTRFKVLSRTSHTEAKFPRLDLYRRSLLLDNAFKELSKVPHLLLSEKERTPLRKSSEVGKERPLLPTGPPITLLESYDDKIVTVKVRSKSAPSTTEKTQQPATTQIRVYTTTR